MGEDILTDQERINNLPKVVDKGIFAAAYLSLLEDKSISLKAKFIWLHLRARRGANGYTWFGQETAADLLDMTSDTYRKFLNELENKGAIKQYKRYFRDTGAPTSNIIVCYNYDPYKQTFVIPENISEIDNAIIKLFSDKYIIKIKDISKPKAKKPATPKPKKSVYPQTEKLGLPPNRKIRFTPTRKIRFTPPEKLGTNNRNSNKRNLGIERKESSFPTLDLENIFKSKNLEVINLIKAVPDITNVSYKTWLEYPLNNADFNIDKQKIILPCENEFTLKILQTRYLNIIKKAYKQIAEFKNLDITIEIKDPTSADNEKCANNK